MRKMSSGTDKIPIKDSRWPIQIRRGVNFLRNSKNFSVIQKWWMKTDDCSLFITVQEPLLLLYLSRAEKIARSVQEYTLLKIKNMQKGIRLEVNRIKSI